MSDIGVNKTVWIDLTDMLIWRGHFTGIQRVAFEYATRFEKDEARFCAFDRVDGRFFELELGFLKDLQETEWPNRDGPEGVRSPSRRQKLRRAMSRPYHALGEETQAMLRPIVDMTNFYIRYGISKFDSRDDSTRSQFHDRPSAIFAKTDTVLLLGASWNDQEIIDKITELKENIGFKLIQHINDLLPIYQPQLFSEELPGKFRQYINKVIHHASMVTVISEATKRDVRAYCEENDIKGMNIEVVRLGEDLEIGKPLRPETIKVDERYILAVGTFEVRKNYILLYQAVKLAQLEGHDIPRIVIAGRKGWLTDDLVHTLRLDPFAHEHILWLDDVSDNELSWLYENCMFSIFPSLAEGWGLPIVESMHHGKMVLASGVSSMLEIGDGHVDYFLPYDARECLEKIRYYVTDARYKGRNMKVRESYRAYTWNDSYARLREVMGLK